jgi:hypothetical protein
LVYFIAWYFLIAKFDLFVDYTKAEFMVVIAIIIVIIIIAIKATVIKFNQW